VKKTLAEWLNDYATIQEEKGIKAAEKFAQETVLSDSSVHNVKGEE
jgi:hypothetical protein